jgi:hypothetical protein
MYKEIVLNCFFIAVFCFKKYREQVNVAKILFTIEFYVFTEYVEILITLLPTVNW